MEQFLCQRYGEKLYTALNIVTSDIRVNDNQATGDGIHLFSEPLHTPSLLLVSAKDKRCRLTPIYLELWFGGFRLSWRGLKRILGETQY